MDLGKYTKVRKPKIYSKEMDLADQIYEFFKKKLRFGLIMRLIKTKGYHFIYECFSETKQAKFPHKLELFLSLVGKTKIKWIDTRHQASGTKRNKKNNKKTNDRNSRCK